MIARTSLTRLGFFLALLSLSAFGHADSSSTRAARLTYVQGTVTVNQPGYTQSVPAQLNLPLLTGVQIATANDGQAEVEFEDGSIVRLTPNTVLSLDNLAIQPDGTFVTNLSLLQGLAYCELRATPQYRYSVNAGGDVLSPVENATVRINFDQPPAIFSVFDGTAQVERQGSAPIAEVSTSGYATQVRAGESLRGDPNDANRYFLTQQIADDSWDQWNEDRDQAAAADAADSTNVRNDYAGAQGYGWSDLDANGNWYDVPGQGPVWQPQVANGDLNFDPYGYGAWVWYPNSGYLWASGYSWGWTPYRCGNWSFYSGFGWGWAPGTACGGFGWGFAGGGRPVNIVVGPVGYHPIRVPVSGTPHPRPILPVMTVKSWDRREPPRGEAPGPRQIAGVTAQPIRREGHGPEPGGGAPNSALRRDYPVDSKSRAPVLGLASTGPAAGHTNSGSRSTVPPSRPTNSQPAAPGLPETVYGNQRYPSYRQPSPSNTESRPVQGSRSQSSAPEVRRPVEQAAPVQTPVQTPNRTTNQPAPVERPTDQYSPARRPAEQAAPVQPSTQPAPSYPHNAPQPTNRSAPPAERPVERSAPPPAQRSSPPPQPTRPSYPAPPPSPPPAASHSAPAPPAASSNQSSGHSQPTPSPK
jgi:FecR protein